MSNTPTDTLDAYMPFTPDTPKCGAKLRKGGTCRRVAMANGRCDMHGGKTPKGIAAGSYRNGRSAALPARLRATYESTLADPDLLSTRNDIALIEARLQELLGKLDLGEAGSHYQRLLKLARDPNTSTATLIQAIQAGADEHQIWDEIYVAMESRRKHSETEQRRLVAMGAMVSAEDALVMADRFGAFLVEHVADRAILAKAQRLIDDIIGPSQKQLAKQPAIDIEEAT